MRKTLNRVCPSKQILSHRLVRRFVSFQINRYLLQACGVKVNDASLFKLGDSLKIKYYFHFDNRVLTVQVFTNAHDLRKSRQC